LQYKNQNIEQCHTDLNRRDCLIADLEHNQQEQKKEHEALEAQVASLTVRLSESKNRAEECEIKLNQLQQELRRIESTNITLVQDLETHLNETQSLKTLNKALMTRLQARQETITQLESHIDLKDEEIDALLNTIYERDRTIEDKSALIQKLQTQFKTYRHWMDHTVIPHLRTQRKNAQDHHYTELNQLLTELHEAKKFMNRQAQYLDGLKSDVHWLNVQNQQLSDILTNMSKERTEQYNVNKKRLFRTTNASNNNDSNKKQQQQQQHQKNKQAAVDDDVSDSVSFSSRSTISNQDEEHHKQQQRDIPSPCTYSYFCCKDVCIY
jgi:chromosome segregation ATPase